MKAFTTHSKFALAHAAPGAIKRNAADIIAAFFILLFAYTGINKLYGIESLQYVLKRYPLIGQQWAVLASWAVPITELLVTMLLFIPKTRLKGLQASFVLMMLFTLYIGYMLAFTQLKVCTCGGMLQALNWWQHLLFNIGCILLAATAIKLYKKYNTRT